MYQDNKNSSQQQESALLDQIIGSQLTQLTLQRQIAQRICDRIFNDLKTKIQQYEDEINQQLEFLFQCELDKNNQMSKSDQPQKLDLLLLLLWKDYEPIITSLSQQQIDICLLIDKQIDVLTTNEKEPQFINKNFISIKNVNYLQTLQSYQFENIIKVKLSQDSRLFGKNVSYAQEQLGYFENLNLENHRLPPPQLIDFLIQFTQIFKQLEEKQFLMKLEQKHFYVKAQYNRVIVKLQPACDTRTHNKLEFYESYFSIIDPLFSDTKLQLKNFKTRGFSFSRILEELQILKYQIPSTSLIPSKKSQPTTQVLESLYCNDHPTRLVKYLINNNFLCFECIVQQKHQINDQISVWEKFYKQIRQEESLFQNQSIYYDQTLTDFNQIVLSNLQKEDYQLNLETQKDFLNIIKLQGSMLLAKITKQKYNKK